MEIQKCLVKHGATKIVADYEGGIPISITFCIYMDNKLVGFSLPANYNGVLRAMQSDKNVPKRLLTKEQALKVSWRIVKDWIEAQMAIIDSQLADMAEVFLPYAITQGGNTLYKELKDSNNLLLNM